MSIPPAQKEHIRQLLSEGKKIHAIKYLRENFGLSLRESKQMADLVERDIIEDAKAAGEQPPTQPISRSKMGCLIGTIFTGIGLIFLAVTGYLFIDDLQFVNSSVKGTAIVVDDPGTPTFEYMYEGETYTHTSSVSSNPPSYSRGEEVGIFINPNDPYDIVVDTFTDRWFVITLLGVMGSIFFGVGFLTTKFLRRT